MQSPSLLAALSTLVGLVAGALAMYIATGFIGPPDFERMRLLAVLLAMIPGIAIAGYATYRYVSEKYLSYGMRDGLWTGTVFFVILPLLMWLAYPHAHARIGATAQGWAWQCSDRGCAWSQEVTRPRTTTPEPPRKR